MSSSDDSFLLHSVDPMVGGDENVLTRIRIENLEEYIQTLQEKVIVLQQSATPNESINALTAEIKILKSELEAVTERRNKFHGLLTEAYKEADEGFKYKTENKILKNEINKLKFKKTDFSGENHKIMELIKSQTEEIMLLRKKTEDLRKENEFNTKETRSLKRHNNQLINTVRRLNNTKKQKTRQTKRINSNFNNSEYSISGEEEEKVSSDLNKLHISEQLNDNNSDDEYYVTF